MQRILVIGCSGAGKSTFARKLSAHLSLPFFASDHFYWESGWQSASPAAVREQLRAVLPQEAWVLDGNFDTEHEWVWPQADCIVWLDYSRLRVGSQIVSRNCRWVITQELTWSGNRMTLARAVSGIKHALKSFRSKRRRYPQWLASCQMTTIHRFDAPSKADSWLESLPTSSTQV